MTRRRLVIIASSLVLVAAVILLIIKQDLDESQRNQERVGFRILGSLVLRMLDEKYKGTVRLGEQAYIASFEDFFNYVHAKMPAITSSSTASNPFPGLLPYDSYKRPTTQATNGESLLLWTNKINHAGEPLGDVQYALTCDGRVKLRPDAKDGPRFGYRKEYQNPMDEPGIEDWFIRPEDRVKSQ